MKRKGIIISVLIIFILVIGGFILLCYIFGSLEKKISFSYNISVLRWDKIYSDTLDIIRINGNNLSVTHLFLKNNSCINLDYTITKKNSEIEIIADQMTNKKEETECALVELVEINMTLENGNYTLNFYDFRNKIEPSFYKKIIVNGKENCAKEGEGFFHPYLSSNETSPEYCCEGLSGLSTPFSISIADECYWNGAAGHSASDSGICGNGICENIEIVCTCPQDCIGKNKSTYKTINDFCNTEWEGGYEELCKSMLGYSVNFPLCNLCNETFLKCLNETKARGEYLHGSVWGNFKANVTDEKINNFIQKLKSDYPSIIITRTSYSIYEIKVPEGTEAEWICRLKDNEVISFIEFNYITYASGNI